MGVDSDDKSVNPAMSEKYTETLGNISGGTAFPSFNWSATNLSEINIGYK